MKAFIAETPAAALAQIQAELGPEAVVLSVRQIPTQGLARLLPGRRRVEVLADVPAEKAKSTTNPWREASDVLPSRATSARSSANRWRSVAWLESMGLLPVFADRLQVLLAARHGVNAPASLEEEWSTVKAALVVAWRRPPALEEVARPARPHVFIGPPGSGKTTVLCKWLTKLVLTEERAAHVWRLDAGSANTSEFLTLHCEMLGVPVDRFWSEPEGRAEWLFVDLPGADAQDPAGLTALHNQIALLPAPRIHLVLNAAYETAVLLEQWRAFESLLPEDVILTHLDEERRRVKLWNLIFGTNCSVRYLSGGNKIPGEFRVASPEFLFPTSNSG